MRLTMKRGGIKYVLKTCGGCGDEWYAKPKQNKCSLCGSGLVRRTKENEHLNWDELRPTSAQEQLVKFYAQQLGAA